MPSTLILYIAPLVGSNEASQNPLQGFIVHSAFLRLYLGSQASQAAILKLTESLYGTAVDGIQVSTIVGRVLDGIVQVDLSTITVEPNDARTPERF